MIQKGYSNEEIGKSLNVSYRYVRNIRSNYNKGLPPSKVIKSRLKEPRPNTKSRLVFDYYNLNPRATPKEAHLATGVNRGTCFLVRNRYAFKI